MKKLHGSAVHRRPCRHHLRFRKTQRLTDFYFTILDSELDKPMGQVSGFWLTWYYFGYSKIYGNLIALAQVLGGVMLMFRRTALIGSCLLLPVVTNIVLVDIFYGVDLGALLVALFIELLLLIILSMHRHELLDFFWTKQNSLFASEPHRREACALGSMLCGCC